MKYIITKWVPKIIDKMYLIMNYTTCKLFALICRRSVRRLWSCVRTWRRRSTPSRPRAGNTRWNSTPPSGKRWGETTTILQGGKSRERVKGKGEGKQRSYYRRERWRGKRQSYYWGKGEVKWQYYYRGERWGETTILLQVGIGRWGEGGNQPLTCHVQMLEFRVTMTIFFW